MPDFSSYTAMPWNDYKSQITEVNISSGITKIGDYSFRGTAITSVDIPSTCTTIGKQAFGKCEELREIYIPESVTSVGSFAFALCKNLCLVHYDGRCTNENRISLNGVRANGKFIEKEGTGSSVITSLPSSWEYYTHKEQCAYGAWVAESGTGNDRKLFFYAQKPEARVSYAPNEGINSQEDPIAHPWRVNCDKYTSIEINRNVSAISKYELVGYEDPNTGVVKGYSNVQTITVESGSPYFVVDEDGVLYNKAKSTLYLYPATKTATHFDVPKAVKNISYGAFCGAKNLQSISFHSTVNQITFLPYAFANASSLSYMSFAKSTPPSAYADTAFKGLPSEGVVVAPTETDEYKEFTKTVGSNWTFATGSGNVVSYLSSDGTLYVAGNGEYTTQSSSASWYSQRSSIKKIVVGEGITNIGSYAFENCSNVTEVTLNNKGYVDYCAFKDCSALTRVNIGPEVTEFKMYSLTYNYVSTYYYPFSGCSNLITVNITDLKAYCSIKGIQYLTDSSYGTAEGKNPLQINGVAHTYTDELVIPEGVTSISQYAFRYFPNVANIKLPSTMTEIASSNFRDHIYLTDIIIPSTVTSVGSNAFSGCNNLKRIYCRAKTCPSVTSSIATNPSSIILNVTAGTASLYRAADVWKDFDVVEGELVTEDWTMFANQNRALRFYTNARVVSWSVSDESVVTRNGYKAYASNFVYDGTTETPYKTATITAELENGDLYVWNIKVNPSEVTLTDGNVYKNTEDFEAESISYTRTFSNKVVGKWQCFYVPFDIEITDELLEDFDFAKLYMVSYLDANDNGELEDDEPLKMILNKLSVGKTLKANLPYYIRVKSSGEKTITVESTTLKAAVDNPVSCSTMEHEYIFTGTNETTNIKGYYTMGTSGGFSFYTKDTNLKPYRWYMEIKSRTDIGGDIVGYARPIMLVVEGEDEVTGIADLEDNASAPQNDKIYTLDGRQVTDYDTLPSGIYIINGKKVFKK